jgi:hypothetical protein
MPDPLDIPHIAGILGSQVPRMFSFYLPP